MLIKKLFNFYNAWMIFVRSGNISNMLYAGVLKIYAKGFWFSATAFFNNIYITFFKVVFHTFSFQRYAKRFLLFLCHFVFFLRILVYFIFQLDLSINSFSEFSGVTIPLQNDRVN